MRGCVVSQDHELRIARMRRKTLHKKPKEPDHREFVSGFIRLHILHHAAQEPLVGFWMIEELRRHGYEMSPGTIYPLLFERVPAILTPRTKLIDYSCVPRFIPAA